MAGLTESLAGVGPGVAFAMLAWPEAPRFLGLPDAVAANVRKILVGALLAALMY